MMRFSYKTKNRLFLANNTYGFFIFTFVTVDINISRVTAPVTVSSLFVTWKVIQTVTTTVADTVISKGPVITTYNSNSINISYLTYHTK